MGIAIFRIKAKIHLAYTPRTPKKFGTMLPKNNPFTSKTYRKHWMHHFFPHTGSQGFDPIGGVAFTPHPKFPLWVNVGMYKTHGVSYSLEDTGRDFTLKNRALLIYDVPGYFNVAKREVSNIIVKRSAQYKGYAVDLSKVTCLNDYLNAQFSSKGRKSIITRMAKLERDFTVEYRVFHGEIERAEFTELLERMYSFISLAFEGKSTENSHTPTDIRAWYNDMLYEMINEGRSSFFVIYADGRPIAISVNYHADNILFASIPSYDPVFRQYGIGNIVNLKKIGWAIQQGYEVFDLSKASYGYKQRWANLEYDFEYHIIFDKRNLQSLLTGYATYIFYQLKQQLRLGVHWLRKVRNS